jgi:ribosome biogenesis GTPase
MIIYEMDLITLGINDFIKSKVDENELTDHQLARITAVDKESYIINGNNGECRAELTGRLLYAASSPLDYPTVGDWVYVQYFDDNTHAIIHGLVPRKSLLKRKTSGKAIDIQLIAANIDVALIIQSLDSNYNLQRLERYLVVATESGIRPIILLSKSDLVSADEIDARLSEIKTRLPDIMVTGFSNLQESSISAINELLAKGETFCLLGSSGVGKTTLLNNLLGDRAFKTRSVREKDRKGRHTTSRRQLTILGNGAILIDTPGMRELGAFDVESGIESTFAGIVELARKCRFSDCSHIKEDGCAVLAALEDGKIEVKQYENFLKLVRESEYYSMSYLEKRKKDKAFGKMVKSFKKTMDNKK